MAGRGRPFIFCKYEMTVGDEILRPNAQLTFLQEMQGKLFNHRAAQGERPLDSFVMRPREHDVDGEAYLTWSVGQLIAERQRAEYDIDADRLKLSIVKDDSVKYTDFIAVPSLGVLAADDRTGDMHFGGKSAINRLKSVIRGIAGADISVMFTASADEVSRALSDWSLTSFKFTVQPNNPRPVSRLAEALSEQMKKDGIGVLSGHARPKEGQRIQVADDGVIRPAADLVEAGYGQLALAGEMPSGQFGEIKKPRFDLDRSKNEQNQRKERELRVHVEDYSKDDDKIFELTALSMIGFYSDDGSDST